MYGGKMIKNRNVAFGLYVVLFVAFWNLLDFIYSVVIVKGSYSFSAGIDLGLPLLLAVLSGYFLFLKK